MTATATPAPEAIAGGSRFDLELPWQIDPKVALRPESFGALAYHFGTRRLTFIKSRALLDVVRKLDDCPSARQACAEAGIASEAMPLLTRALGLLADSNMIIRRGVA